MPEYVQDDELLELEEGPQDAQAWVGHLVEAKEQMKAWEQRKIIAETMVTKLLGSTPVSAFEVGDRTFKVSQGNPKKGAKFNHVAFFARDIELSRSEVQTMLMNAKGFDIAAIDPGLAGNDPRLWKPKTKLGELLIENMGVEIVARGSILTNLVRKLA